MAIQVSDMWLKKSGVESQLASVRIPVELTACAGCGEPAAGRERLSSARSGQ